MWPRQARSRRAVELALDESAVEVEEGRLWQPVCDRVREQSVERCLRDRSSAEAGDRGSNRHRQALQGDPDVERDDAANAARERLLDHEDTPRVPEDLADLVHWPGPERLHPDGPDLHAVLAHLVDGILDRPKHGAERDHDRVGVLAAVAANEPAGGAAEPLPELGGDPWNHVERLHLLRVGEVLDLGESL